MFIHLISNELLKAFNQRANQIYFIVLFLAGFLLVHIAAGAFDSIKIILAGENNHLNGAHIIGAFLSYFKVFLIFVVAATVSSVVFIDYKHNTLSMIYTSGVSKFNFIVSKLIATCVIVSIVMGGAVLGHVMACLMPYLDASYFQEFNALFYLSPFVKNYLLNTFIFASVFVAFTFIFRSSLINWVLVVLFYGVNAIATFYFQDIDTSFIGAMMEPTGSLAAKLQVHGLSADQLDNHVLKLEGVYLYNRLMWLCIALSCLVLLSFKFNFQYQASAFSFSAIWRKKELKTHSADSVFQTHSINQLGSEGIKSAPFRVWVQCYLNELKFITSGLHFVLTFIIGSVMLMVTSSSTGSIYETSSYPVTYEVVELILNTFDGLLVVIIALMAGELIWRERAAKCSEIHDVLPQSKWLPVSSKMMALISVIAVFLLLFIGAGLMVQNSKGFDDYQIGQYFISLFGLAFVDYILFVVLAFFAYSLINNKYLALLVLLIYYFSSAFGIYVFEHNLLKLNSAPGVTYSDLNGYGNHVFAFLMFKIYWLLFAVILVYLTQSLWVRGEVASMVTRMQLPFKNTLQNIKPLSVVAGLFLISGAYIFYNTNVLNNYKNANDMELQRVAYETKYKKHEKHIHPEITNVEVDVDIFPESRELKGHGVFELTNTSSQIIETILLNYDATVNTDLKFSQAIDLSHRDHELGFYIYSLKQPLKVNETMTLAFNFELKNNGFNHSGSTSAVNENGTFINSMSVFPAFGYDSSQELLSKRLRSKHGLPDKPLALSRGDEHGLNRSIFGMNSHFTDTDVTISTSQEQTAFSSGNLIKQWSVNGRNYYHYKNRAKVQNFIPFVSGDYLVKSEIWQDELKRHDPVEISIHYFKAHGFNVDKMMESAKDSLTYYSDHFAPYAQDQLRIIEFPRTYGRFAQSFPATIPFSESIGFLSDLRELADDVPFEEQIIDVAYFVTAHEIAHQWWAHQVSAADVEGVSFLIESLSQYSALKVVEQKYGKEKIKKFLRTERQKYLLSRGLETHEERPLARSLSSQQALVYNKGSLSLYALDNYLGSGVLDEVLQTFIAQFAYQSNPYPTSQDFIDLLYDFTAEELHYFIDDHLNKITLYETDVLKAEYKRDENLEYQAEVTIEVNKFYADEKGKEVIVDMNELIEIGIYNSDNDELELKKVWLQSGENKLLFNLKRKPKYVVIDPYYHIMMKGFEISKESFTKQK